MAMQEDKVTGLHLPAGSRAQSWRCKKGHVRTADKPFILDMLVDGEPVMRTGPLCAICFKVWLERQFLARPVTDISTNNRRMRRRAKEGHHEPTP